MSDIVERLDELAGGEFQWSDVWEIAEDAATEIKKLRKALKPFSHTEMVSWRSENGNDVEYLCSLEDIIAAKSALGESDE